jgi:uncharacterized protein (TIGR02594 family)
MIPWISEAIKYIGVREIHGPKHAAQIVQFWKDIKRGGIKTDEVPWCAAFVGAMLEKAGFRSTRYESAGSYESWGMELEKPCFGCIAVFRRTGGGHVGFVVGKTAEGKLQVLGGNQNDQVCIAEFPTKNLVCYCWPIGYNVPDIALTHLTGIEEIESMV